jgi:hypothetical protein
VRHTYPRPVRELRPLQRNGREGPRIPHAPHGALGDWREDKDYMIRHSCFSNLAIMASAVQLMDFKNDGVEGHWRHALQRVPMTWWLHVLLLAAVGGIGTAAGTLDCDSLGPRSDCGNPCTPGLSFACGLPGCGPGPHVSPCRPCSPPKCQSHCHEPEMKSSCDRPTTSALLAACPAAA